MPNLHKNFRACIFLLLPLLLLLCASLFGQTDASASQAASGVRSTHILGLEGVKRNLRGTLTVQSGGLDFTASGAHGTIAIASIQDVFTAQDSRQTGGKALTVLKMGVPYGGGRVVSLFSHEKLDSLTIQYRDANGGLHGVVFTMPLGQATVLKKQLVDLGVHVSIPVASQPEKPDAGGTKQ